MLHRIWAGLFAGLVTFALRSSCPAAPQYKLLDLGTFGNVSIANDINEAGSVVGQSRYPDGRIEAFRTQPNSPINPATDGLGNMGGGPPDSYAEAVNDLGQVIGSGWVFGEIHAAFAFSNGLFGPGSDLGPTGRNTYPVAINNRGQLVVTTYPFAFRTSGLRPINMATDDLGTLGGPSSNAGGINASGQVVGGSFLPGGEIQHAYRTGPDAPINPATDDIGGLGGNSSYASAINDIGQVVGSGLLPNGDLHAFRTAPGAAINPLTDDLGTLGLRSVAADINNSGVAVGYSEVSSNAWHAFVCFPDKSMADLNELLVNPIPGAVLTDALALNNSGQIVGRMLVRDGATTRAFLLTPVPEPATVILFGVGSLAVVGAFSNCSRARDRGRGQPAAPSASRSLPVATMFHAHAAGRAPSCLLWTVLLLTSAASPALAASGDIYNLGIAAEGGNAVNSRGQVAGYSITTNYEQRAFLYTGTPGVDGHMADLGTLHDTALVPGSIAYGLNANGQVVGDSDEWETYVPRAFLYTGTPESGGAMLDLGDLFPDAGGSQTHARGINASGQVVGFSAVAPSGIVPHAFLYTGTPGSGGAMADLGTLTGPDGYSRAYGINAGGQVVGDSAAHAFLYTGTPGSGGAMADLGTLPGKIASQGLAINDVGQVVGCSGNSLDTTDTTQHAFLYTGTPGSGGAMADLGTLGGTYSVGRAINISGQVVGHSKTTGGAQHAFLYTGTPGVDGHMIDLDTWLNANNPTEGAKWTLTSAAGVNDAGLITGYGAYNDGPGGLGARAFLLDASALVSTSLPGDYNHNGKVDAADYVVWRKNQGTTNSLPNDPTGGAIGTTQYNTWRANFGKPPGSGSGSIVSATVPEPSTLVMLILAAAGRCLGRRRTA